MRRRSRPVGPRTDVDQEVAVLRDDVNEVADQPDGIQAVGLVLLGVLLWSDSLTYLVRVFS